MSPSLPIRVSDLDPNHACKVLELVGAVAAGADTILLTTKEFNITEEQEREYLAQFSQTPGAFALGMWQGDRLLGTLFIERGNRSRQRHVGTLGMSVLPEARNCRIGTQLLRRALERIEQEGVLRRVSLSVFGNNPYAIRMYEKAGFVHEGRREGAYCVDGMEVDEILMGWKVSRSEDGARNEVLR